MLRKWYFAFSAITAVALYYAVAGNQCSSRPYNFVGWKSGDIIFIEGKSFRSSIVRLLELGHSDYSHVGLIVFDHDVPFVINADPQRGRVVKERWDFFLSPNHISGAAIFRVIAAPEEAKTRACAAAERYYSQAIPFNSNFDWAAHNKLYCTQLIWRAYLSAGIDLRRQPNSSDEKYLLPSELIENKALVEITHF